jgi:hypothetical protein
LVLVVVCQDVSEWNARFLAAEIGSVEMGGGRHDDDLSGPGFREALGRLDTVGGKRFRRAGDGNEDDRKQEMSRLRKYLPELSGCLLRRK